MIKNKLKVTLFFGTFLMAMFGLTCLANAQDLLFTNDTIVTIGSANYVIANGSTATTVTVGANNIVVAIPGGASFTFVSPDKYVLNYDAGSSSACGSSQNSLTITTSGTFTITPDTSTTCGANDHGGSGAPPPPPPTFVFNTIPSNNLPAAVVTTPTPPATNTPANVTSPSTTSYLFTKQVTAKSTKTEVKNLQTVLNSALGLKLKVDGSFGAKTTDAIKKFQKANKITPVNGLVGPKTLKALNAIKVMQ